MVRVLQWNLDSGYIFIHIIFSRIFYTPVVGPDDGLEDDVPTGLEDEVHTGLEEEVHTGLEEEVH